MIPTNSLSVPPTSPVGTDLSLPVVIGSDPAGSEASFYTALGKVTLAAVEMILRDHCAGCGAEFDAETFGPYPPCC